MYARPPWWIHSTMNAGEATIDALTDIACVCAAEIAVCYASGDPHFRTFDAKMIHFQGICKYDMASPKQAYPGLDNFNVYIKTEERHDNNIVSYVGYMEILVFGYVIRLGRNKVVTVGTARQRCYFEMFFLR